MARRGVILVLISLALGAVSTVAVAWGIAANRPNGSGAMGWGSGVLFEKNGVLCGGTERRLWGQRFFALDGTTDAGTADLFRTVHRQLGTKARPVESIPAWVRLPSVSESTPRSRQFCSNAYGLPVLAMRGIVLEATKPNPSDPTAQFTYVEDYWLSGHPDDRRTFFLPLGIIWPGFLVNMLIYAAAWFLALFLGERSLRAISARARFRHALRRGTCPTCCYDLRGDFSTGCPECGWNRAITSRS